jgi:anti-sigma factor RsiW
MSLIDRLRPWRRSGSRKAARVLACQELVEIITDYLEDALSPADRERLEGHIAGCVGCTAYLEQMRMTVATVGRLREHDIPTPALEPLLAAFRAWKQGQPPELSESAP